MARSTQPRSPRFPARAVRAFTLRVPAAKIGSFLLTAEGLEQVIRPPIRVRRASDRHYEFSADDDESFAVFIDALEPGRRIAWTCRHGRNAVATGAVLFQEAPGDQGTEFSVAVEYHPSGGKMGAWLSRRLPGGLPQHLQEAMRRTKALREAGEIPTNEGQPKGSAKGKR